MAGAGPEAGSLAEAINEDFLKCGICFDSFTDPRGLPCLHVFCHDCLTDWAAASTASSSDRKSLTCPVCKKNHRIPEEGFPIHFMVTNLREAIEENQTKVGVPGLI